MPSSGASACNSGRFSRKRSFGEPDLDHLPRIVPFVDGGCGVETFVALEPNEPPSEPSGEDLGDLGLADAGLAFEKQRTRHSQRQEDRRREAAIGDVVLLPEEIERCVDVCGMRWRHEVDER